MLSPDSPTEQEMQSMPEDDRPGTPWGPPPIVDGWYGNGGNVNERGDDGQNESHGRHGLGTAGNMGPLGPMTPFIGPIFPQVQPLVYVATSNPWAAQGMQSMPGSWGTGQPSPPALLSGSLAHGGDRVGKFIAGKDCE